MKRKPLIILSLTYVIGGIYAYYNVPWVYADLMVDGCGCGREREYILIGRNQYNMVIKKKGNPSHKHMYWDPNWKKQWNMTVRERGQLTPYRGTDGRAQ